MNSDKLKLIVEALIFASDTPISITKIASIIGNVSEQEISNIIANLENEYSETHRAFKMMYVSNGIQLVTRPEYHEWVSQLFKSKRRSRLSQQALETLAIIAYKQPVTKIDIDTIRGVDSSGVLGTLLERDLIKIAGREKTVGRPLLYKTTDKFLEYFGLNLLTDLPRLKEIESLIKADEVKQISVFSRNSSTQEV